MIITDKVRANGFSLAKYNRGGIQYHRCGLVQSLMTFTRFKPEVVYARQRELYRKQTGCDYCDWRRFSDWHLQATNIPVWRWQRPSNTGACQSSKPLKPFFVIPDNVWYRLNGNQFAVVSYTQRNAKTHVCIILPLRPVLQFLIRAWPPDIATTPNPVWYGQACVGHSHCVEGDTTEPAAKSRRQFMQVLGLSTEDQCNLFKVLEQPKWCIKVI